MEEVYNDKKREKSGIYLYTISANEIITSAQIKDRKLFKSAQVSYAQTLYVNNWENPFSNVIDISTKSHNLFQCHVALFSISKGQ